MDIDELAGKDVTNAYALTDTKAGGIAQIVFQLNDVFLIVGADKETDELRVSVETAPPTEEGCERKQLSNQRKQIAWIWRMTNQYGYEDGLQVEFDDLERTNVQIVAEAARLDVTVFRRN